MYIPIWVFILGCLIIVWKIRDVDNKIVQEKEFSPIKIGIIPRWPELFKDYKLADIADEQKLWEELWKKHEQCCGNKHCIFKDGATFTLLKSKLIYSNDWSSFRTEVDFRYNIEELSEGMFSRFGFYVKWGKEGFDIGITTPESRKNSYHILDDRDLIKVATIPYAELKLYKYSNVKEEVRNEALKKNGWVREMDHPIPLVSLKHKYFDVDYFYV